MTNLTVSNTTTNDILNSILPAEQAAIKPVALTKKIAYCLYRPNILNSKTTLLNELENLDLHKTKPTKNRPYWWM